MNKTSFSVGFLLITSLLTACHHNPLKTQKEYRSTQFLINASMTAALQVNPKIEPEEAPYAYLMCMRGKAHAMDCPALYKEMVHYAKSPEFVDFKSIRLADLTDRDVFDSLREGYEIRLFNADMED